MSTQSAQINAAMDGRVGREITQCLLELPAGTMSVTAIPVHEGGSEDDQTLFEGITGEKPSRFQHLVTGKELAALEQPHEVAQFNAIQGLRTPRGLILHESAARSPAASTSA